MLSPLIPLYTEEAWHYTPPFLKKEDAVYKLGWFEPKVEWCREDLAEDMELLAPLKESVLKTLEEARKKQYTSMILKLTFRLIGNSLQADLVVSVPISSKAQEFLSNHGTPPQNQIKY
jgi:isoleucyl-tRNA synthetase